ncbi:conserved hypothetical protein [uncultured delta proteobacterium]|uniref:UPF0434 protein KL86DPRO_20021 n=1 Tax=uncultured delta proteobacterium TaxID=34034 RepID=A0A212JTG8_9DELT|nr:conserved hypothetical protein [uncultured delta proteobacterium]
MTLDPALLHILACPVCRGGLEIMGEAEGLACARCAVVYPIRDEIPVMLAEEAVAFREWSAGKREAVPLPPKP